MAERLVELCTLFVEDTHGVLAAQIFSALASRGRSSLATIAQVTRLPPSRIQTGLTGLIQHHIIKYYDPDEDDPQISTFYHADLDAAYNLIRSHKYIRVVSDREGEAAGKLLANIIEVGHATVGDLENAYDLSPASKRDSGIDTVEQHVSEEGLINGIVKDGKHKTSSDITSIAEFHSLLRKLLDEGYLVKVNERSYMPQTEYEREARQATFDENEYLQDGKLSTAKQKRQFDAEFNSLKRKWEDEDAYSKTRDVASKGSIKRVNSSAPSSKRIKTNGDLPNGAHHEEISDDCDDAEECVPKLPNDLFVRVNFAKSTLLLRNLRLVQMAHYYLGEVTASVFAALLRSFEKIELKSKAKLEPSKVEDDEDDEGDEDDLLPSTTDIEVLDYLDKAIDIAQGVKVPRSSSNLPNGVSKKRVISDDPDEAELGIKVEKESDDEDEEEGPPVNGFRSLKERNKRLALIGVHLNILAEHKKRFVKRSSDAKASRVDIAALTTQLIQDEVDTMISNRYSNIETRIVRCLRERGKLEEKPLQSMTMMRLVPMRMHLTFLQFAGLCDSQEIPKDASRQPNRVLHLWCFNEKRVVNQYLHRAYQGMSRSLQRLRVEREGKFKAVLEKSERDGVKGREQELLSLQERNLLKEWQEVEERLLVQVDRLDDLVGVLRDFPGGCSTLIHT